MSNRPTLSVVVPMYKEEDVAQLLVERVHDGLSDYQGNWELVCVDDGSPDQTVDRLKAAAEQFGNQVRVIELQRNFGQTAAMQAGIDAARGELIVTMDGDLQNDPKDIPRMVDELIERDLDLLQGWRVNRQDAAIKRKLPSKIANRLIAKITGVKLHDYGCSLKVYRASVLKQVRLFGEMHRFIPVWVAGVTSPRRIGETPVTHHAREFGESKYGISRTFRVIIDIISVFFFLRYKARPGHFFGSIGLASGAIGGAMLSWLFAVKFFLGEDIGSRPMLMIAIFLILMALQFLTTGVIAEMLSRIFFQDNRSASFVVRPSAPIADDECWKRADHE
ncbi:MULTISPECIES: glycosyltransferase family 2 protein [unclassified Marinobacterium]|jgi:glycosyltransferase involved in cell wall biosynthesis|uniref:glycosyltransferase family 2 protein n=1 Tax=unclassified Marinobacterium TaxID=2644139 RepID=UPI00156A1F74|nr:MULTISPECIES: glycosyltransferase family 2 protein [unclassified Marinobacterium]NRP36073.1 Undecaprenyl-phosphate 4-deoxy-4-formamido-L-arabinose transferase [Marinobacterium sp. xm-d-579]NRP94279.1 Undecaprenyl-phosphate 4-deoxy-4-formamido-L-arabinose transferase [Marinobacterium sp. xm-g-59]NRQ01689.1 Undecaprenyl-phosphate 4-deoxy-4-formamido-L-arabinose transferase [Marinobacterium sp. xm-d-530]